MQLRALTMSLAAGLLAGLAAGLLAGCGGAGPGKIMADTKVPTKEDPSAVLVPYTPPDISELTGIDEDEDADAGKDQAGAPAAPAEAKP